MLQEKQNNFSFDRLDEQALPGELPLDKNLSWQRLEAKLAERPAARKPLWYMAAAAVLFIGLISIIFLNQHQKADEPVVKNKENTVPVKFPPAPFENAKEAPDVSISPAPVVKKPFTRSAKENAPVVFREREPELLIDTIQSTSLPLVQNAMSDTVIPLIAKAPKKLTVVHFNELQEEDRIVNKNIAQLKTAKPADKKAPEEEYAGTLNFRIRF